MGVQVRSLTRRLVTAEKKIVGQQSKKKIVGQQSKKPKKTLQRDAQPDYEYSEKMPGYEYSENKYWRVPPPVKVLPNSYLTVSPEGKVVEITMPVKVASKVVWARWP